MWENDDYYQILQVDRRAEDEVIEGAYKRLCKKYHPDLNRQKDAEERMKKINVAYATLRDGMKRANYDLELIRPKHNINNIRTTPQTINSIQQAKKILTNYLYHLSCGELNSAYNLISNKDKKNITIKDFIKWQKTVSSIYEILDFNVTNEENGIQNNSKNIAEFTFNVFIIDQEIKTGIPQEIDFTRKVIFENGYYKVLLGYKDIKEITSKLTKSFLHKNSSNNELQYDRQLLMKEISKEIYRATRYKRIFSVVIIEAIGDMEFTDTTLDSIFLENLKNISHYIRACDVCGRWNKTRLLLLLPETKATYAKIVAEKILVGIKRKNSRTPEKARILYCAGIAQYRDSCLQEIVEICVSNVINAKSRGAWSIVY